MKTITARTKTGKEITQKIWAKINFATLNNYDIEKEKYPIVRERNSGKWSFELTKKEFKDETGIEISTDIAYIIIVDDFEEIKKQEILDYILTEIEKDIGYKISRPVVNISKIKKDNEVIEQTLSVDNFNFLVENIFDFGFVIRRKGKKGFYSTRDENSSLTKNLKENTLYYFDGENYTECSKEEKIAHSICEKLTSVSTSIRM